MDTESFLTHSAPPLNQDTIQFTSFLKTSLISQTTGFLSICLFICPSSHRLSIQPLSIHHPSIHPHIYPSATAPKLLSMPGTVLCAGTWEGAPGSHPCLSLKPLRSRPRRPLSQSSPRSLPSSLCTLCHCRMHHRVDRFSSDSFTLGI